MHEQRTANMHKCQCMKFSCIISGCPAGARKWHISYLPLEFFLSANGVDGVVIDDEQDFQSFLENNHQYWDYVEKYLEASIEGQNPGSPSTSRRTETALTSWPTSALLFRASRTPMPENTAPS